MSQDQPIDYEAVLSDLERQKATIENAIAALRQAMTVGMQVANSGTAATGRPVDPLDIPGDAFFGLSIAEAVKKYLTMVKRKQTIQEIADALERGGLPHTSADFAGTVRAMVNRQARSDSDLVRVGPGSWGLSAWYGNRRPKEAPTKPKRKRDRKKQTARPNERQATKPSAPPAAKPSRTVVQQAEEVLRDAGSPLLVDALVEQIEQRFNRKVGKQTLVGILSERVRKQQTFTRPAPNTYGLVAATLH